MARNQPNRCEQRRRFRGSSQLRLVGFWLFSSGNDDKKITSGSRAFDRYLFWLVGSSETETVAGSVLWVGVGLTTFPFSKFQRKPAYINQTTTNLEFKLFPQFPNYQVAVIISSAESRIGILKSNVQSLRQIL